MVETYRPENDDQVRDLVAWAVAEEVPLEIVGAGTKRELGRPVQVQATLDLGALSGILFHEPEELVLRARAATPLAEIEQALAEKGQELAFEPPDLGPLLGSGAGRQTIGGVIAANLSGSRRLKAGAARDHFLGVSVVTGRGDLVRSGGRVVKNVTGYDLCKVLAGAHGTLGVMTEVTVKVLPRGEKTRTVLVIGLDEAAASEALRSALAGTYEVSGAAHVPAGIGLRSAVSYVSGCDAPVTAVRVEGPPPSVGYRCRALREMLGRFGPTEELHSMNSWRFWGEVGSAAVLDAGPERAIWRVSVPPAAGAAVARKIVAATGGEAFFDWGGGLIWAAVPVGEDACAGPVRRAMGRGGGHATLVRAPESVRAAVEVFEPMESGLAALTRRIKDSFDPNRVLNPGRMYGGV